METIRSEATSIVLSVTWLFTIAFDVIPKFSTERLSALYWKERMFCRGMSVLLDHTGQTRLIWVVVKFTALLAAPQAQGAMPVVLDS